MKQNFKRKLLAGVLTACMVFQTVGTVPVYAAGNAADSGLPIGTSSVCTHHVHDENCGYTEGTPCTHEHSDECNTEVKKCTHEHTAECYSGELICGLTEEVVDSGSSSDATHTHTQDCYKLACTHICSAESGCITKELACKHVHDNACGYKEGTPCTFDPATCESCNPKNTVDNRATLANEVYAVYDGSKFCAATAEAPTVPTTTEITDSKTITNLYIKGKSIQYKLMSDSVSLKTVTCADTVTVINNEAFSNCTNLTSVEMPSVTTIGEEAFSGCAKLTSVEMPKVTSIGTRAFYGCGNLASVAMPNVTQIGKSAFSGCANLTSVNMPGVTTIGESAFYNCAILASVAMPKATGIGDYAFYGCAKLTSVELPDAISIGRRAFSDCTGLTSVAMPSATSIGDSVFNGCTGLTSVELPDATSIGNSTFYGCVNLTSVELPDATSIGNSAFYGCAKLASLTLGATPPTVGTKSFTGCPTSRTLIIQSNPAFQDAATALAAYKAAADGNVNDNLWYGWTLPSGITAVTSAGTLALTTGNSTSDFGQDNAITLTATFDKAMKVGKQRALAINEVEFKDGTNTLGTIATATLNADGKWVATLDVNTKDWTAGTHKLTAEYAGNLELGGSTTNEVTVTVNESYAVYDGSKIYLATKTAPSTATTTEITDKKTINHLYIKGASVPKNLMYDTGNANRTLKTVTCADTVITIGDYAFKDCENLTSAKLPSATTIGVSAFMSCTSLTSLTLGATPPTVGTDVFTSCHNPRTLIIQGNTAFQDTVLAAYKAAADGGTTDDKWYGWTLPTTLDSTGVAPSAGKLTATGNATTIFGTNNVITLTATFDKAAKVGKQRALAINQVEFKDGANTLGAIATAAQDADGKWVATLTTNTKDWTVGEHKLTAEFAGNHELSGIISNTVTVIVNEVYAVYDGSKFCAATADAPTVPTTTEITDKTTINNLYVMGASVPQKLMKSSGSLKTVTCADTVTSIGVQAFSSCTVLTSVAMPNVTGIEYQAFYGCANLTSVEMSEATSIAMQAFAVCKALTSVKMPKVTSIGEGAFFICKGLKSVELPSGTAIGKDAFYNCASLANVAMPKVTSIGESAFYGCEGLTSLAMPKVTSIGTRAFYYCTALASVAMPKVTTIGEQAFRECTKLTSLTLGATPPATVGTDAFLNCPTSRTLTIQGNKEFKDTVLAAYKAAADGGTAGDELWYGWTLPATLDGTGVSTSAGTLEVTTGKSTSDFGQDNTITLTATFDKAAKVGKQRALTINQVEFKDGANTLGTATAAQNTDGKWVATLTVNTKDWALGAHNLTATFAGNHELSGISSNTVTVTVNESYAVYEGIKFYRATKTAPSMATEEEITSTDKNTISYLYIKGESVPANLMYNMGSENKNLKTVTCADTVTTIGEQAFKGCTSLASVEMPEATGIGNKAFQSCTKLTSINMPEVTIIASSAFSGCVALTSAKMPKVTTIDKYAFENCAKLASVAMPNATTIGKQAFFSCTKLASVEMPKVSSIGDIAFSRCTALASLTLGATPPTVGTDAFAGSPKTNVLTIQGNTANSEAVLAAYKAVNDGSTSDNLWYDWILPTAITPLPTNAVQGHSLTLNGDIGVNFYVELTDEVKADTAAVMEMTCAGKTTTVKVSDAVANGTTDITDFNNIVHKCYKFSTTVFAKQMTDEITAVLKDGNGTVVVTNTYSVAKYAGEATEGSNENLKNLTSAMVGYGGHAQKLFKYNTDNLAGGILTDVSSVKKEVLSSYAHEVTGTENNLTYYGSSLILKEKTTLRVYFQLAKGTIDQHIFNLDGNSVLPRQSGTSNLYYVEIPDVAAQNLELEHTITAGGITVSKHSALSYVYDALSQQTANADNTNTASALYLYWDAAEKYYAGR